MKIQKLPNPSELFNEASGTVEDSLLFPYLDTIVLLREKGFSYRGAAKWLSDRGVQTSHTTLRNFLKQIENDEDMEHDYQQAIETARATITRRGHAGARLSQQELAEREEEEHHYETD